MDVEAMRRRLRELLGTPFLDKGRLATDGAVDCYGLALELCRAGGVELPDPGRAERIEEALRILGDSVEPVESPVPGALVAWRNESDRCDHVGLYLGRGQVAQATRAFGVVAMRMPLTKVQCYVPRAESAD